VKLGNIAWINGGSGRFLGRQYGSVPNVPSLSFCRPLLQPHSSGFRGTARVIYGEMVSTVLVSSRRHLMRTPLLVLLLFSVAWFNLLGSRCFGQAPKERFSQDADFSIMRSVAFSPDGKLLASSGMDNNIKIWDVATGKTVAVLAVQAEEISPSGCGTSPAVKTP
jgi:WD40 repeat protein